MTSKQDWKLGSFELAEDNNSFLKQLVLTILVTLLKKKRCSVLKGRRQQIFPLGDTKCILVNSTKIKHMKGLLQIM